MGQLGCSPASACQWQCSNRLTAQLRPYCIQIGKTGKRRLGLSDYADKHLFVAGPGEKGGLLCAYSVKDGKKLNELRFGDTPIFDGMAAAGGRIYVATRKGKVFCFDGK